MDYFIVKLEYNSNMILKAQISHESIRITLYIIYLGRGLPVTPILTTGLAATLSSPPILFVAEHLHNDDDGDDDGDDDDDQHLHNPWCL